MKREEDEMQKKGKPREVRGNVGGDGKEERRWRERERKKGEGRGTERREPGKRPKRTGWAFERGGQSGGRCRAFGNLKLRVKQLTSVKGLLAATYWAGCHVVILFNPYTNTTLVLSHLFFFFLAAPCGLWHASFPTRD